MALPRRILALRMVLLALMLIVSSQIVPTRARNPGLQVQVSQGGLKYAGDLAVDILGKNLDRQNIPDQSGQENVAIGKVDYTVSNMKIISFTKPSSTVAVNPGVGLTWSLQNAGISMTGDWRYQYKKWFIKIRDHGSFEAPVSGASASVSVSLTTLPSGNPTISMLSCSCTVAKLNIKFRGGASWLYNLFSRFVERPLQKQLEKEVCKAAEKTINNNAASLLQTLKTRVTIEKRFVVDYSLIGNPMFASGYFQTAHKGEVLHVSDSTSPPFDGTIIQTPAPTRMATTYVNEYIANSLGYVLYKYNILWFQLTKTNVPENYRSYLATTCSSGICFGTLFPAAANMYPEANVELNMTTTIPPAMSISPQGITGTINGRINIYARLADGSIGNLISVTVKVTLKVSPSIRGNTIVASVSEFTPQIIVENSHIGDIPTDSINQIVTVAANAFILPQLNGVGQKGLEIPSLQGVTFVGPSLTLTQGAIVISTDVNYAV